MHSYRWIKVITLLSPADQKEIKLQFTYVVIGAGWVPQYDVRADSKSEKIEVDCFAMIKQSTGEDWKDVTVEISTAKPSVQGTPPELSAWHVDIYQPKPIPLPSPKISAIGINKSQTSRGPGKSTEVKEYV